MYLPGFADLVIEGQVKNPLTSQAVARLPDEIRQQAQPFLGPGFGTNRHTVLGPLFRPDASKEVIAANYHLGISVLQRAGLIGKNSASAQALLDSLNAFLKASTGKLAIPTIEPSSPLEQVIQQALLLAFKE